jgi:hypothetical protein
MSPIGAVWPGGGGVTASGSGEEKAPPMAKVRFANLKRGSGVWGEGWFCVGGLCRKLHDAHWRRVAGGGGVTASGSGVESAPPMAKVRCLT